MHYREDKPVVVQQDRTIYVEVQHPDYEQVRNDLAAFAELVKSPEYIHTYRITPITLWNAASSGRSADQIVRTLEQYVKFPLSYAVKQSIYDDMSKFGRYQLIDRHEQLYLVAQSEEDIQQLIEYKSVREFVQGELIRLEENDYCLWGVGIPVQHRGAIKQQCIQLGLPLQDHAGYRPGEDLPMHLAEGIAGQSFFQLRDYQKEAVQAFIGGEQSTGGHGILALPCGAGKTIIGMATMVHYQAATLVLTTNQTSVKQWKRELLEKTSLTSDDIGEYSGTSKDIRPVTIATYQILTHRSDKSAPFKHMHVFQEKNWGLIIYDEVHLLPAPIFRATAEIQSTRRLGLTATLIREDGRETDVFSLIGPKRFDVPWKAMEQMGYIAHATCTEVRVDWDDQLKKQYYLTAKRQQTRLAQENPRKVHIVQTLLKQHEDKSVLIIGGYVEQLRSLGVHLNVPVITGQTSQDEREALYHRFRQGDIKVLAVSKVANFAVDLPDAAVAIQISGTFGSRQEEAQRLGRILRPKQSNEAYFYHIVTKDTKDQEYAAKRQMFLVEQGYHYKRLEM